MDFHAAMETFAEAWVAANTQTPLTSVPDDSPQSQPVCSDGSENTPAVGNGEARVVHLPVNKGSQRPKLGLLDTINQAVTPTTSTGPGGVKSMPIHCIVEQVQSLAGGTADGPTNGKLGITSTPGAKNNLNNSSNPVVEMDTYAILPGTTMFSELVRTALIKIGYTASEAIGAKGAIQIKQWKPLTFDTITENPNCTLDEILGDLTSIATLRIRLCSQSKVIAMEEVKEKLLQFLLDRSQMVLSSLGCPIEKKLLAQISRGDYSTVLPDGGRDAFNKWYKDQMEKNNIPPPPKLTQTTNPVGQHMKPQHTNSVSQPLNAPIVIRPDNRLSRPTSPTASSAAANFTTASSTAANFTTASSGTANFTSPRYDPDNSFAFRSRARTSFDIENEIPRLQKWFGQNQHPSRDQMVVYLEELNSLESRKGQRPLDLTNIIYWFKNARAAVRRSTKLSPAGGDNQKEAGGGEVCEETVDGSASPPEDVPVPELPNRNAIYVVNPLHHQQEEEDQIEVVHPNEEEDMDDGEREGISFHPYKVGATVQDISETNNNCVDMEQEHATDLSIKKTIMMQQQYQQYQNLKREYPTEGDYLSASSSSPSPTSQGTPTSQGPPPAGIPTTHTALQMAAMSHALSMHHYMHPAALYQSPPAMSFNMKQDPSSHSPNSADSMSLSDRKKRSRVFIDPLSEIPKLEKWFEEDTHPSSYMIEKYTDELNSSAYRLRFPKLEPKNVQLWFKNHRAKVKRQRLGLELESPSPSYLGMPNDSMSDMSGGGMLHEHLSGIPSDHMHDMRQSPSPSYLGKMTDGIMQPIV